MFKISEFVHSSAYSACTSNSIDILWTYLRKWNWEITTASEFRSSILLYLVLECSMIKVRRMETRSEEWKIDRGNGTSV